MDAGGPSSGPPIARSTFPSAEQSSKRRRLTSPEPAPCLRATINDLPEELIEAIALYLNTFGPKQELDGSQRTGFGDVHKKSWRARHLYSFCLVSKKFSRIAKPILHSLLVNDDQPLALRQFLTRVLEYPDLAACLRTVVIGDFGELEIAFDDDEDDVEVGRFRAVLVERARQTLLGGEASLHVDWLAGLDEGLFESAISLLLTLAPNLHTLDMETGEYNWETIYTWTLRLIQQAGNNCRAGVSQGLFLNLRHIVLRDTTEDMEPFSHNIQDFLWLPSLRKLEIHGMERAGSGVHGWPNRSSNVDTVLLSPSTIPTELLANILGACKELKTVVYQWSEIGIDNTLDVDGIHDALRIHKDTLEILILETKALEKWLPYVPSIGPLKEFTKLRHLQIGGVLLFDNLLADDPGRRQDSVPALLAKELSPGREFFPPSLESLSFDCVSVEIGVAPEILGFLLDISEVRQHGALPNLRLIQVTVPPTMWDDGEKASEFFNHFSLVGWCLWHFGRLEEFRVRIARDYPEEGRNRAFSLRHDSFDEFEKTEEVLWWPSVIDAHGVLARFS